MDKNIGDLIFKACDKYGMDKIETFTKVNQYESFYWVKYNTDNNPNKVWKFNQKFYLQALSLVIHDYLENKDIDALIKDVQRNKYDKSKI